MKVVMGVLVSDRYKWGRNGLNFKGVKIFEGKMWKVCLEAVMRNKINLF